LNKLENRGCKALAKNFKLKIKNAQLAEALKLGDLKAKLAKRKADQAEEKTHPKKPPSKPPKKEKEAEEPHKEIKEEPPRIRARSKSAFAEAPITPSPAEERKGPSVEEMPSAEGEGSRELPLEAPIEVTLQPESSKQELLELEKEKIPADKLGPTGKHIKDILTQKIETPTAAQTTVSPTAPTPTEEELSQKAKEKKAKGKKEPTAIDAMAEEEAVKKGPTKFKEYRDIKPARRQTQAPRSFDARDRKGLRDAEEEQQWRKKRHAKPMRKQEEIVPMRPTAIKIRTPISIKDLASEMKLKASQLVSKLFLHGLVVTLNDLLDDETTIQLLGQEFGCEVIFDKSEQEKIRITDKSIKEEIKQTESNQLKIRPPVVAFMGHVDHGKTSLIDAIRKSNRAAGEAGAITQHIGAFRCTTPVGDITILDTPGHEAFSAMRARGADVTDIVVLVIAGDEGFRQQTNEAILHARAANVTIVVALNKSDKPNFNAEQVYRQLADVDLLPEAWGGQTITVNCSAVTGEGIKELLEMLALQAEVLELNANPNTRARGIVLESEMYKGLGPAATVLVLNGSLGKNDSVVFGHDWGRIKNMQDEFSHELEKAGPSTPVLITGLSGLPEAGEEFIVVKSEREAKEIAEMRTQGLRQVTLSGQAIKKISLESFMEKATETQKKVLNLIIRADVQGSLEALKTALLKIESQKAEINIIFGGVGDITESDVQLAAISKAVILGFHTNIENHAEPFVKQLGITVRLHNVIYHAIDNVKELMAGLLEKLPVETEKGKAEVKATFKSSQFGVIAGCIVTEGSIHRNHSIRVRRGNEVAWTGPIASLKRVKEDVREVQKGLECGILLNGFNDVREGDILEAFEVTYISQEL
jgi:translation initiation factor IF-2